ncbi:MAG: hypothetical protein HN904_12270 [Victivallales bacterium]|nr:hypothetical protein [Victivallales bacterium]
MTFRPIPIVLTLLAGIAQGAPRVKQSIEISKVWSGHPVGFSLLTTKTRQFAAFYDDRRRLTVVGRDLGSDTWQERNILDTSVGWDSHNYVTMAEDADGYLHLSGNMHCVPLIYYRTEEPGDATSFVRVKSMVGSNEKRCTYPRFMNGPDGVFVFHYRDGHSGNGNEIYNMYDHATRTWKRMLDQPLTDGQGKVNAYANGPKLGPDGRYHLLWMWRVHGGCETNHHLSYARSADLKHWETVDGTPLTLPITPVTKGVIVDPTPVKQGMINMGHCIGFDAEKRVVLTYHKYDANGKSQVYNARFEDGKWVLHQATDWDYRWEFSGGGSVPCEVRGGSMTVQEDGSLRQTLSHKKLGGGLFAVDPVTLKTGEKIPTKSTRPRETYRKELTIPGISVRWSGSKGTTPEGERHYLRWETLGSNRDRARPGLPPPPSTLRLYVVTDDEATK